MTDGGVTELLRRWREGESDSMNPLFNSVYPRLRRIAAALFRGESPVSMLQPTSVINELFIKLMDQRSFPYESREHFFCLAASAMRRILIDQARAENRQKRDGGLKVPLHDELVWVSTIPSADLLDIDRALQELHSVDPRKSQLIELRFFLGATTEETADLLNLSTATVERDVKFARGWLHERLLARAAPPGGPSV